MNELLFNPFEDRTSRDIRNALSEALAKAIHTGDDRQLISLVDSYLEQPLAAYYKEYINNRASKYKMAIQAIGEKIKDPIHQGIVLWNLELFFEFHEILEHAWYHEQDVHLKHTMQALIRSAGVYIKREYGFMDSADRIAGKALPVLQENYTLLSSYFLPDTLISTLGESSQPAPRLA